MQNLQKPDKPVVGDGSWLQVHSVFLTIQGEGPFVGERAVFIRLAGCNLQCPLCDTDYTSNRASWSVDELMQVVAARHNKQKANALVVITGGEPFRQPIGCLVEALVYQGYRVQIETNGTLYQPGCWGHDLVTIVCSPKTGKVHPLLQDFIAAWKYVATADSLKDSSDGLPTSALGRASRAPLARPSAYRLLRKRAIYLQPADEGNETANAANLWAVVSSCLTHGYKLCLQIHKFAMLP
jgi:organic radical activating enzyme